MAHLVLLFYSLYFLICSKTGLGVSWVDFVVLAGLLFLSFLVDVGKAKILLASAQNLDNRLQEATGVEQDLEGRKPTTQEDPFFSKIK
tara:strand:- start:589 stop:852 length:264 start_codon:yes stop_codon:yes gene_type:complete